MDKDTQIKQLDTIYEEATGKLQAIAKRHKDEIDAYIQELEEAKVKKLEKELRS